MVPMIINHRSRNLSNDRHIQEAISNRHTSLSQGDIDTNNYFSSAFTCTGTGGWAPTVAAQRINGCAAAGPHASMAQKLRRPAARPSSTSSRASGEAGGRASAAGKERAAPCRPNPNQVQVHIRVQEQHAPKVTPRPEAYPVRVAKLDGQIKFESISESRSSTHQK